MVQTVACCRLFAFYIGLVNLRKWGIPKHAQASDASPGTADGNFHFKHSQTLIRLAQAMCWKREVFVRFISLSVFVAPGKIFHAPIHPIHSLYILHTVAMRLDAVQY